MPVVDPKLPTFAVANSFNAYLIYVLYEPLNDRIKQIGAKKQIDIIIIFQYETYLLLLQVCN